MSNVTDATIELEDDTVVEIDDGSPPPAPAEPPEPPPAPAPADDAQTALHEAIEKERKGRETAEANVRAERQRAEDQARLLAARDVELRASRETVEQREVEALASNIESKTRELEALEGQLSKAQEEGDFKAASAAQVKIARTASALDRMEARKADYEAGKLRAPPSEGRVEAPQPQVSAFEQYVGQYDAPAQAWLRAHPECVPSTVGGNPVKNAKMMKGHYEALARSLQPNTPEYFKVIEDAISDAAPAVAPAVAPAAAPATKPAAAPRAAAPSAPPSRDGTPVAANAGRRSVTLTREQQESARLSWPKLAEKEAYALYAKNLVELQKEGKIGRTYT